MHLMKKRPMIFALVVAFLLVSTQSMAVPEDPKGAYGFLWGDSFKIASEKINKIGWKIDKDRKDESPQKITDIMSPSEKRIDCSGQVEKYPAKIRLRFFNDHLFSIIVNYKNVNKTRDEQLEKKFISRYGNIPSNMGVRRWVVEDTQVIFMKADTPKEQGFYSCLFHDQISVLKKAEKDWLEHVKKEKDKKK